VKYSNGRYSEMRTHTLISTLILLSATIAAPQESVKSLTAVGGSGVSEGGDHILRSALGLSVVGVSTSDDHVHTVNPFQFLTNAAVEEPDPEALAVNRTFNVDIKRGHDRATVSWESRFPGINDVLRSRPVGETVWEVAESVYADTDALVLSAVNALSVAGIDASDGVTSELTSALEDAGIDR
jgi:hypothetical protein